MAKVINVFHLFTQKTSFVARRSRGLSQNHTRYRLYVAPDGSESKATHINMYKFCEITLTIIINM